MYLIFGCAGSSLLLGFSLVATLLWCTGFSWWWLVLLAEHGLSGTWASLAVTHGLRCSTACGIFLDQGLNLCLLHWQADSLPLSHQGSPEQG